MKLAGWRLNLPLFQWQPTTTAHDPNPPITLEDAPASSGFKAQFARVTVTVSSGGRVT